MIKTNDLAKQFELVVKQEIKNYQDSLNFVLQSIRELKEEDRHIHNEQMENYASLHSAYVGLQSDVQCLKDLCFSNGLKFERALKEHSHSIELNSKNITDVEEDIRVKINNEQIIQSELRITIQSLATLRAVVDKLEEKMVQDIRNISNSYQRDIQRSKEDILNAPTKADQVRKELSEKLDCHKVDVEGIMRELNIYKKENHVTQKKIENIYTLIERLQKSGVSK